MIIYQSTKKGFLNDVFINNIEYIINDAYSQKKGYSVGKSEQNCYKTK